MPVTFLTNEDKVALEEKIAASGFVQVNTDIDANGVTVLNVPNNVTVCDGTLLFFYCVCDSVDEKTFVLVGDKKYYLVDKAGAYVNKTNFYKAGDCAIVQLEDADDANSLPAFARLVSVLSEKEEDVTVDGAVLYTEQTLTDEQKAQARANIGIAADGSVVEVDTTLSMPGVAADAKAVGDTINRICTSGKNIIDLSKVMAAGTGRISDTTGELADGSAYVYGDYKVVSDKTYTLSTNGTSVRLYFYNADGSYTGQTNIINITETDKTFTFVAPAPILRILGYVNLATKDLQIEIGDTATEYEPFHLKLEDSIRLDGSVLYTEQTLTEEQKAQARDNIDVPEVDNTLSVVGMAADAKAVGDEIARQADIVYEVGKNKFDVSKCIRAGDGTISGSKGEIKDGKLWIYGDYRLISGETYTVSKTSGTQILYFYREDGSYTGTTIQTSTNTFVAPAPIVRVLAYGDLSTVDFQIELGKTATEYESFGYALRENMRVYKENVEGLVGVFEQAQKNKYNFRKVDVVCDRYSNESVLDIAWNGDARVYFSAVYGVYDDLCTAYPNYVTKRELPLHTVDLGDGKEPIGVWCYDFTPPTPVGSNAELCKIFYCSGTHGGEATPPVIGARFFKDLCENWKSQDLLRPLRFNCKFTVIPMVNPYGFANGTKNNERGVNLNRNFSKGWVSKEGSGSSAASETITQVIESMIATEGYNFCLDHHTYGYFNSEPNELKIGYCCSCKKRPEDVSCAEMIGFWANGKAVAESASLDSSQPYFKQIITSEYAGQMFDAFTHGYCFETMGGWGYDDAGKALEAEYPAQKLGAEVLGTMLYSAFVGYHSY